ncbi:copper chaperone PCu(A)C [bacterium]|nr:copper chaperone PCu(A)C [bacterium]
MNRKLSAVLLSVFATLLLLILPAQAHEAADIYIDGVWATPCQETNDITSVFMTVDNTAVDHPIALIGASSPFAEHIHLVEGDGSCAEGITERIVIPFGERMNFREASYAIAVEMNELHEVGEPFSLTLTFDMLDDDLNSDGMAVDVVVGVPILDEAPASSDILIVTPWVRPTAMADMSDHDHGEGEHAHDDEEMAMDMPMFPAAVYLRLLNRGEEPDRLIAASSPVAEITEIHQTTVEDDVMRMGEIEGLDLPVDEWMAFEPGGYHIMLVNLQRELFEGEAIPLTLTFESGTELTITVPVYDPTMGGMDDDHDHDHSHDHGG